MLASIATSIVATLRNAQNGSGRRSRNERCKAPEVLDDGGENKLILGALRRPEALERAMMAIAITSASCLRTCPCRENASMLVTMILATATKRLRAGDTLIACRDLNNGLQNV
jgi:hypothetical protein